jgi:hypothetical protein
MFVERREGAGPRLAVAGLRDALHTRYALLLAELELGHALASPLAPPRQPAYSTFFKNLPV